MNVIKYLFDNNNKFLKENLANYLNNITEDCFSYINEGFFNEVKTLNIPNKITVNIKNKKIFLDTVIKSNKHKEGSFNLYERKDMLFITSDLDSTCEAIILLFMSQFWYDSKNPYTPFLFSIYKCERLLYTSGKIIDTLVLEKYGLKESFIYKQQKIGLNLENLNFTNYRDINTRFTNFHELLYYSYHYHDKDFNFELKQNSKIYKFNLIELIDNTFLHVLIALDYFEEYNLILLDQHIQNIFLQWINDDTFIGEKNISKLKNIYYNLDKETLIEAPVNNFIIKLGDVNVSILKLKKDLTIIGDLSDVENLSVLDKMTYYDNHIPNYKDFILNIKNLPFYIFEKTKIYKILKNDDLLKNLSWAFPGIHNYDKFITKKELIKKYYSEFIVKKNITKDENNFIIEHF